MIFIFYCSYLPAAAPGSAGNTTTARVIRYYDMGEKPVQLCGFVRAGSFYGRRYSQKGTDKTGAAWFFRGGKYKVYYSGGMLKEEKYYARRLYFLIFELYAPNGVWKFYDSSGKKYMEEIYVEGRKKMVINYGGDGKMVSKTSLK